MSSDFFVPDPEGLIPSAEGYFGAYGGKFIPEALVAAVDEVAVEYDKAKADPAFAAELNELMVNYTGRPSALTEVPRFAEHVRRPDLPQARGPEPHRLAQDQQRAGPGAPHQAHGQDPRHRRDRGLSQHGVATATACALFGLDCTIYMGEIDTRRQALNVARMRMLGAEVVAVKSGSRTLKDAINEAFRDWVANVDRTHYLFGTVAGPHPFPAMVRDFHRVIGVEARRQLLERTGRLPDAAVACVGGGSNAIGLFHAFIPDADVRLVGCEPAGHGVETGEHAATLTAGEPGILHGSRSYVLQDDEGQITEPYSISASTTRASARSTPTSRTWDAASTARSPTRRPWGPCGCSPAPRASSRPSRAPTPSWRPGPRRGAGPGRADPGQPVRPGRQGHGHRGPLLRAVRHRRRRRGGRRKRPRRDRGGRQVSGNIELLNTTLAAAKAADRAALIAYLPASRPWRAGSRRSRPSSRAARTSSRSGSRTATPSSTAPSSRPPTTSPCAAASASPT